MPLRRFPSDVWSLVLGVAALARATAYWRRPPTSDVSTPLEALLPWNLWAALLGLVGALVLVGFLGEALNRRLGWVAWFGHVGGVGLYTAISLSYLTGAVANGATWSGVAPVLIIAALHQARADRLGQEMRYGH